MSSFKCRLEETPVYTLSPPPADVGASVPVPERIHSTPRRTLESLAGFVASCATFPNSWILLRLVWVLWTCLLTTLSERGFLGIAWRYLLLIDYQEVLYRSNACDMDGLRWKT